MEQEPTSLQEAIVYFANPDNCRNYVVARRWPDGVTCPTCGSSNVSFLAKQNRWECRTKHSKRQFSLKTGTIYEDSPLGMDKWLTATWMVTNCKNGVSSCEIARALNITQKTAWFLDHRIRVSFGLETPNKFSGTVEADETFIGQKARNMHASVRARKITGTGGKDKTAVMGILERGKDGKPSQIRTNVVGNRKKKALQAQVREHVQAGSAIYTDALKSYEGMDEFKHEVVDHAVEYVRGKVHTNGCENFWSLLKRSLHGTYVSVEPFHLFRYLDEQSYRFNNRHMTDSERFDIAVRGVVGKRLMYDQLTGKVADAPTCIDR
jgi:transposase-like protein